MRTFRRQIPLNIAAKLSLARMGHFFFHIDCDGKRVAADEAIELPDVEAACELAVRSAAEIAADDLKSGRHRIHQVVVVADENHELLSVKVEAALEVAHHHAA